jgi:hypothetical protein
VSTLHSRHNTWHENNGGGSVNTLNNLARDAWRLMRSRSASSFPSIGSTPTTQWRRESSTLCDWNLFAIRCAPRIATLNTEVSHATQERAPRRRLVSKSPVNDGRASHPRLESNAERASLGSTKSSERSSVATIHARATLAGDFKNCCMLSGEFDGSDRHHFFSESDAAVHESLEVIARRCMFRAAGAGGG